MKPYRKVCICELDDNGNKGVEKYAVLSEDGRAITDQFDTLDVLNQALERCKRHLIIKQMQERNKKLMEKKD